MPTIGQGLTMFGAGIGSALSSRRERKRWRELAEVLAGIVQPGATGKAVSELAPLLAGVGQAMPIPEHMGGNALPFSTPQFTPQQQAQLRTPAGAAEQNAATAPMRAMLTSGIPQAREMALKQMMGGTGQGQEPRVNSVSGGYVVSWPDGRVEYTRTEEKNPEWGTYIGDDGREHYAPKGEIYASGKPTSLPKTVDDWSWEDAGKNTAGEPLERRVYTAFDPLTKNVQTFKTDITRVKPAGVTVNTGDMGKLNQSTATEIQKNLAKSVITQGRLNRVREEWNPDWSYMETQGWQYVKGMIDKSKFLSSTVGKAIPEESWRDFEAYKAWDRDMQSAINNHIHDMTGAQMSANEIKRLLLEMATKSDGPKAYKAKIDATIAMLADAQKEWERMLQTKDITVEEAQAAMNEIIVSNLKMIAGEGESEQPDWAKEVE